MPADPSGPETEAALRQEVERLRESEQKFRRLFESVAEGYFLAERQAFLLRLSDALRPLASPVEIQDVACRILGEHLGVDWAQYSQIDVERGTISNARDYFRGDLPSHVGEYDLSIYPEHAKAWRAGLSLAIDDVETSTRLSDGERTGLLTYSVRAALTTPLIKNGKPVVVMAALSASPRSWSREDIAMLEETADRTWAAVERARAETALRANEEKYRSLFDTMGEGFTLCGVIRDTDGRVSDLSYIVLNRALEQQSGMDRQKMMGKRHSDIFPPIVVDRVMPYYARAADGGEPVIFSEYIEHLDRWYDVSAYPQEQGTQLAILYRDVTSRKHGELALRESEERQAFLLKLSDALRAEPDENSIATAAVTLTAAQMRVDRCWIAVRIPDEGRSVVAHDHRRPDLASMKGEYRYSDFPETTKTMETGTFAFDDIQSHPTLSETDKVGFAALRIGAELAASLRKGEGQVIWSLAVADETPRRWTRAEATLLEEAAERTWAAVERARAEAGLRESESQLTIELADTQQLQHASSMLIEENDVTALYRRLLVAACAIMRSEMASIQKFVPGRNELLLLAHQGFVPESAAHWQCVKVLTNTGCSCGRALAAGERVVIPDVEIDEQEAGTPDLDHYRRCGIRAVQSTPLISRARRFVGMISTHWRHVHQPSARELGMLDVLARQMADVIERRDSEEALRESEERLRTVIDSLHDYAIFTLDPDGHVTSWNEGARRLTGYDAGEVMGQPSSMFYTDEDVAEGKPGRELDVARTTGRSEDESWRVRKDGSRVWINEIVRPLSSDDGAPRGFSKISRDLTERKSLEDALKEAHDSLDRRVRERTSQVQSLFQRLVSAQEEERRRMARDIHDQVGQQMTALRMNLETLRSQASGQRALVDQAERTQRLAEELDQSIDFLTWQLRPAALDHLGLSAALQNLATGWSERFMRTVDLVVDGVEDVRLPRDVEANLYRIAQEALHNIAKHADASHATVVLAQRPGHLALVIEDDGRGFDPLFRSTDGGLHLGLVSMRERAALVGGEFEIESTIGHGTSIYIRIPESLETHDRQ